MEKHNKALTLLPHSFSPSERKLQNTNEERILSIIAYSQTEQHSNLDRYIQ